MTENKTLLVVMIVADVGGGCVRGSWTCDQIRTRGVSCDQMSGIGRVR